jgi:phosphoglycolate phosphatase
VGKKAVVFDFDGTIADTSKFIREIKGSDEYWLLRNATLRKVIGFNFLRAWRLYSLWQKAKQSIMLQAALVELFPGTKKLIKQLQADNWDVYVLSNNSAQTVRVVLEQREITDVTVLPPSRFYSKSSVLKQLIRREGYDRDAVWMIGDEVSDIGAAKRAGVQSIAVTWGLQSKLLLAACFPIASVDRPEEIYLTVSGQNS